MKQIYADNAATTAMSRIAIEAMLPYMESIYGNLLQYSCLGNPTGREAWWAAAHGVAKSRT